jgi:EAL domain-containing protein (putative c-di-GMP-specific phosphodiesterase class I)
MYFIGLFLYFSAVILLTMFEVGRVFITTTYSLAPEILTLIVISYFYPLVVFALAYFSKEKKITKTFFQSQVILASTLCVSLGLIGTFLGLSEMVASISAGMNADGDFNVKITSLLGSIGSSLDAMSLAFLTSILGVGASVVILVCCNYIGLYFKDAKSKGGAQGGSSEGHSESSYLDAEVIAEAINRSLSANLLSPLSASLDENNQLQRNISSSFDTFVSNQERLMNDDAEKISTYSQKIIEQMTNNNNNIVSLQTVLENSNRQLNQSVQVFNENLEKIADFSSEINVEVKGSGAHLASAQGLLEVIDGKLQNINSGVYQGLEEANYSSNKIVTEISTSNESLGALRNIFEDFDVSYQDQLTRFNNHLEMQNHESKALSSVMQDLKFLLAPPLDEALGLAITNNKLGLAFQSNNDKDGKVIGCEVLVRWDDPIRGVVSNGDIFSPDMQNHQELMIQLDKWVLNSGMQQLATWLKTDVWTKESVMSMNVSQSLLVDASLIPFLKQVIEDNMISTANIAIEVNESVILSSHFETLKETFKEIRDLGCKIYVDHYGAGHSSIIMYQQLGVNKLKIARSVVSELRDENANGAVIRSIVASCKELGIEVIAEGVEDEFQKSRLLEFGINYFQGYLSSAPISSADYTAYINSDS